MERELFSWTAWDGDAECMIFYNPLLKTQIGKYPAHTQFDEAIILQIEKGHGILQFINKRNILMGEYKLHYRVGETVSELP